MGWICRILIILDNASTFEVLCTMWPDTQDCVGNNTIYLDDRVFCGKRKEWMSAKCKVRRVHEVVVEIMVS
jgi:hypothetical protein